MADLIGHKLDRYTITSLLGEGGMATVYRAHQETVDRDVALKVIESKLARNPDFLKRFEREARTIGALSHPHILKLFDFGRQGDLLYLVTELLTGGSLADRIRKAPFSLEEARRVLDPVASALDFAHGRGVIHRDLKPQNVLFDSTNNPYLTDFGVAKLLDESTVLTQGGTAMGTPAYMAPEQWQGAELDARTDVYALGVMLFEMLSGRLPFQGDTPFSMMNMHVYAPPPPLRVYRTDLPSSVEKVINKALAKNCEHRFASAGEMASAFSGAMSGKTPPGLEVPIMPAGEDGDVLSGVSGPIEMTGPRRTPPSLQLPVAESEPARSRGRSGLFILAVVALIAIAGVAALFVASRSGNVTGTATPTEQTPDLAGSATANAIALNVTHTATPSASATPSPSPDVETIVAQIAAERSTATAVAIASFTRTFTPSFTPSLTPTETSDLVQTAQLALNMTDTAVAVASRTKTPTATSTPTPSRTASATHTQTLTPTVTASLTASITPSATITPLPVTPSPTQDFCRYVVQPGDTLAGIALSMGVTVQELAAANEMRDSLLVQVNQTLVNPKCISPTAIAELPSTADICRYVVQPGDSLFSISMSMGVTVQELATANGMSDSLLVQVNQTLINPKCAFAPTEATPVAAVATVTANNQWTPVIRSFDGVDMVLVPAGCFMMGSDDGYDDEKPVHEVCFDEAFWIDRTEVTNAQFVQFGGQAGGASALTDANRPREQITWFEARDFCAKRGARLPTEAEWEYAARGPSNVVYPWGNTFDSSRLNYCDRNCEYDWKDAAVDDGYAYTAPIGSSPDGESWVGALDLSGNVREWTTSLYEPYPYNAGDGREADTGDRTDVERVLRGGSWYNDAFSVRAAVRSGVGPYGWDDDIGLRCARSTDTTEEAVEAATAAPERITSNADWTPVVQSFDGVNMVLVPAGCFMMGSDDGNQDELPAHQVCFDQPFWIDRTEVSNHQFTQFGGVATTENPWTPRERITWIEARDYCAQRGARLPSEAEWEYAARGPDSLVYPWGNAFVEEQVIFARNSDGGTWAVGAQPDGASWVGALDLSGNVWEWTSSLYEPYPYNADDGREADTQDLTDVRRVLRGGSWSDYPSGLRAAARSWSEPGDGNSIVGFRCARAGDASEVAVDSDEARALANAPFREYSLSGKVPAGATSAMVGYRINSECECLGRADLMLYELRYTEGDAPDNLVPNPDFVDELPSWGVWGDAYYRLEPRNFGGGRLLHVTAGPAQAGGMNSDIISVTASADYTVTFVARISPVTEDAGYFTIMFFGDSGEVRERIPFVLGE